MFALPESDADPTAAKPLWDVAYFSGNAPLLHLQLCNNPVSASEIEKWWVGFFLGICWANQERQRALLLDLGEVVRVHHRAALGCNNNRGISRATTRCPLSMPPCIPCPHSRKCKVGRSTPTSQSTRVKLTLVQKSWEQSSVRFCVIERKQ